MKNDDKSFIKFCPHADFIHFNLDCLSTSLFVGGGSHHPIILLHLTPQHLPQACFILCFYFASGEYFKAFFPISFKYQDSWTSIKLSLRKFLLSSRWKYSIHHYAGKWWGRSGFLLQCNIFWAFELALVDILEGTLVKLSYCPIFPYAQPPPPSSLVFFCLRWRRCTFLSSKLLSLF